MAIIRPMISSPPGLVLVKGHVLGTVVLCCGCRCCAPAATMPQYQELPYGGQVLDIDTVLKDSILEGADAAADTGKQPLELRPRMSWMRTAAGMKRCLWCSSGRSHWSPC
jgi:hypothetical protein